MPKNPLIFLFNVVSKRKELLLLFTKLRPAHSGSTTYSNKTEANNKSNIRIVSNFIKIMMNVYFQTIFKFMVEKLAAKYLL